MRSLNFETSQHEALERETFVRSMHVKNQDGVCHVSRNKHRDECMQNLKQKEDFKCTRRPRYPKPLLVRTRVFMKVAKSIDAFLIYIVPSLNRC
jgi:hypothetical protein